MHNLEQSDFSTAANRATVLPATRAPQLGDNALALEAKQCAFVNVDGFAIPVFDYEGRTYTGSTNNVSTREFRTGGLGAAGTLVATLTYQYVAAGVADNDKVSSITRT